MSDFIRTGVIDLARYLPEYLTKSEPIYDALLKTTGAEQGTLRDAVRTLLNQAFISMANPDGLTQWELFLGLRPNESDTIAVRRERILTKIRGSATSTVALMTNIINTYGAGYIIEHNDQYFFNIYITEIDKAKLERMKNELTIYKPAHLGVNVYLGYSWDGTIRFDGKQTYGTYNTKWEAE